MDELYSDASGVNIHFKNIADKITEESTRIDNLCNGLSPAAANVIKINATENLIKFIATELSSIVLELNFAIATLKED